MKPKKNTLKYFEWQVRDPWHWRFKQWVIKNIYCRIVGHDEVIKMDGTVLCRRH